MGVIVKYMFLLYLIFFVFSFEQIHCMETQTKYERMRQRHLQRCLEQSNHATIPEREDQVYSSRLFQEGDPELIPQPELVSHLVFDREKTLTNLLKSIDIGNIENVVNIIHSSNKKQLNSSFTKSRNHELSLDDENINGYSPLTLAAHKGLLYVVISLVNAGAKINLKDSNGTSALMHAIITGNAATVSWLLDNNANVLSKSLTKKIIPNHELKYFLSKQWIDSYEFASYLTRVYPNIHSYKEIEFLLKQNIQMKNHKRKNKV